MRSKKVKLAAAFIVIILSLSIFVFAAKAIASRFSDSTSSRSTVENYTPKFKASAEINKSFEFNAINQKKQEKKIKFTLTAVERKDEIKVKNEVRQAPKNYDFLLVRIELENSLPERLAITSSDLVRLQGEMGKLFAPDYHNGNIVLDPLSVKKDLMSFTVKKDIKSFVFQIGELSADKEKVEVAF